MRSECGNGRAGVGAAAVVVAAVIVTSCFDPTGPSDPAEPDAPTAGPTTTAPPSSSPSHSPPTATTGVTAPTIEGPDPGTEIADPQPVLVVGNAQTGDPVTPTYAFQVATTDGFTELVAAADEVPQGPNGRTSWKVDVPLAPGQYFWRARAEAGLVMSPYSAVADFTVIEPPAGAPPAEGVFLSDPLVGGSVGEVRGGRFVEDGWQVTSHTDFIRYDVPPVEAGWVSFQTRGLARFNPSASQFMLFGMWDPTRGDYRANPFRVHIQKLDTNHNRPYIRLRWIANGEQHDRGHDFLDWDPETTYSWHLEWGPEAGGNVVRVYLDGEVIIEQDYTRRYAPSVHWIELGIAERQESIVGTVYSNVHIGRK